MLATQSVRTFYDWKEKLFFPPAFLDLVDTLIKIYHRVWQMTAIIVILRNCYFTSTHRRCIRLVSIIRSHYTISEYNMHDYRGIKFHPSLSFISRLILLLRNWYLLKSLFILPRPFQLLSERIPLGSLIQAVRALKLWSRMTTIRLSGFLSASRISTR